MELKVSGDSETDRIAEALYYIWEPRRGKKFHELCGRSKRIYRKAGQTAFSVLNEYFDKRKLIQERRQDVFSALIEEA